MLYHLATFICFIVVAFGGAYEDEIARKEKIVQMFWANDVSISLSNYQRSIYPINPFAVPIAFNKGHPFVVFLETGKGKSIVLPKTILDALVKKISSPLYEQWLNIMFSGGNTDMTTDVNARDGKGIVVNPTTGKFDYETLYNDWVAGKTGPIFIESNYDVIDSPNNMLAELMGIYLEGVGVSMPNPIKNLTYTTWAKMQPANLPLLAYMDDINNILKYPLPYQPQAGTKISYIASKCKTSAEVVYQLLKKYKEVFQENMPSTEKIHDLNDKVFPRAILTAMNNLIFSLSLSNIEQSDLKALELDLGYIGGYKIDGSGNMPEVGDYEVTFVPKWGYSIPTGLYQLPNSVYEYEVDESSWDSNMFLRTNHLTDTLYNHQSIKRLPLANSYTQTRGTKGKFYSPTGGPIFFQDKTNKYDGKVVKIKFKNVALAPGIDIRVDATHDRWSSGYFKNSSLRWAPIICDTIWFVMELDKIEGYQVKELKDICTTYDTFLKGMKNFSGWPDYERMGFVYDIQPAYGAAHAGHPIVAQYNWQAAMLGAVPKFVAGIPTSYWGSLHEIGHNMQQRKWTFPGFGEITNNVMVLYAQEIFANFSAAADSEAANKNNEYVVNFILDRPDAMSPTFALLRYYSTLNYDFSWAVIGNCFNKYKTENNNNQTIEQWVKYMTEETNMNMVPYHYFYKFDQFFTNIQKTYQEYAHLPVYRPSGQILELGIEKWNHAKVMFNFTEDQPSTGMVPYKFDQMKGIGNLSDPSPLVSKI